MFGGGNEDRWGERGNVERSGGGKTRDCLRRTRGSLERPLQSRSYPAYRQNVTHLFVYEELLATSQVTQGVTI